MPPKTGSRVQNSAQPAAAAAPETFEAALSRLEEIVGRLESGEVTLDESLAAFKEGSDLVRFCLDRLTAAETAVQQLVAGDGGAAGLKPTGPGLGAGDLEDE